MVGASEDGGDSMTPLDAAKRLVEHGMVIRHSDGYKNCGYCGQSSATGHGDGTNHSIPCIVPSLPNIVAALEAAERLPTEEPVEEYGAERSYVFCRGDAINDRHTPGCCYQSLVAALKGEEVLA